MLTDHLHFAVERQRLGITVTNRVLWELKHFYRHEYEVGLRGLQRACQLLNVSLPEEEAGNIAFHIVNARMDGGAGGDAMQDRKSTRLNSSHNNQSRMPSSA